MPAPIVIVGMGGSGTRAVAYSLRKSGLYLGTNTNGVKEDALDFAEFDYRWAPPWITSDRGQIEQMHAEHRVCVAKHRAGMEDPTRGWGWKCCPTGHLLTFVGCRFPELKVIHVVRDGRDMAFGEHGGRTHTLRLGRAVLDGDPTSVVPGSDAWRGRALAKDGSPCASPERQARFWAAINTSIADWGETAAPAAYHRIRLEEFGSDPDRHVLELVAFAGLPVPGRTLRAHLRDHVRVPPTVGRWRTRGAVETEPILELLNGVLGRFGYG